MAFAGEIEGDIDGGAVPKRFGTAGTLQFGAAVFAVIRVAVVSFGAADHAGLGGNLTAIPPQRHFRGDDAGGHGDDRVAENHDQGGQC